ncbi:MAG: MFS transporter [Bdellovibrionales bacterium]
MSHPLPAVREHHFVALLMAVQFVNAVDFMMVMPLAPDFAAALGFSASQIGMLTGTFSIASAIAGFIAALFLDHYSRKRALLFCLGGMSLVTLLAVFAQDLHSMMAVRALTGLISGPIFGICGAFVADVIPAHRRGAAMGQLLGAFSVAVVLGVPFVLELAHWVDWRAPFIAVGLAGLIVLAAGLKYLPYHKPEAEHQPVAARIASIGRMLASPLILASYGCSAIAMMAGFLLIPNIAAFIQMNMGYPRDDLAFLYLVGGAITFFNQRWAGKLVDRTSATLVSILYGIIFITNVYQGFVLQAVAVPAAVTFVLFMVGMTGRGVAAQTLASKVPPPTWRGAYMVVQGAVINIATSIAAYVSAQVLTEENGRLMNMEQLGWGAIILSLSVPLLFWYTERKIGSKPH